MVEECIAQQDAAALRQDTTELWQHSRPADFDSFEKEVAWSVDKATSFGMSTEVWRLPADGVTAFHSYISPIGYRTRSATVDITEPADWPAAGPTVPRFPIRPSSAQATPDLKASRPS